METVENQVEAEMEEFSLADIANLDASEIQEVRFEVLPGGLYTFRGISAEFEDSTNRVDERRVILVTKFEVIEVKSCLDRDYRTPEKQEELIGKKHTQKFYIVPEKAAEGLGLIRAFIGDIGLNHEGPFGGVEGSDPGIVDAIVGHEFLGKIKPGTYNGSKTADLQVDRKKA